MSSKFSDETTLVRGIDVHNKADMRGTYGGQAADDTVFSRSTSRIPHFGGINDVWKNQVNALMGNPSYTPKPRGQGTLEILGTQVVVDMDKPILTVTKRELGYKFMAAEAWWILSGRDDVASIKPYSSVIENFSDDGIHFFGAYGPKIVDQTAYVVNCLTDDPDSRQAVINIWRESPGKSKDIPCTLSLQFILRNSTLNCIATMRSSDIWLGLPYDVFNFSMITQQIRLYMNIGRTDPITMGSLYLTLGSSHLYERNVFAALQCIHDRYSAGWEVSNMTDVLSSYGVEKPADLKDWLGFMKDEPDGIYGMRRKG